LPELPMMLFFPPLAFFAESSSTALALPLSLLIVFATAKLLAEALERIGQPGIVGEIVAGVLIGPSVLNWVTHDGLIAALGDLGVMFLLFRVGLEVKPAELLKLGGTAALVATCGVIVPFAMGWAIVSAWGAPQIEAIFVGAAMVATSVGITAQVLAAKGLLHERSAKIILAAAVIDDVLGLLVLAAVSGMVQGEINIGALVTTCVLAVGFVVIIALWGNKAMGHVVPKVQESFHLAEAEFSLAMVLLFALAVLAVYVGVAAIVGAFFAGMALAGRVGPRVLDLASGATELLVPFFLAGIGLNISLAAFSSPSLIGLTAAILVAAVLSKMIGCGLSALPLGRTDAFRIGVGMIPRGEVGMVVAQIGLSLGAVSRDIYGVVVFMAVASTIVAPPLLALAFKGATPQEQTEMLRIG
jgi:Kef-type K+ transport system membrane component KefB